jgi:poly-beta-1,6-N-acetyl-D-glucosamine biosynthesis protein PgaD
MLRGRKVIELPATALVWAVFVALAGWVVVATGWYVLARLWLRELFVSEAVASTARAALAITAWAGAVFAVFRLWAGYNYRRYHLRERRRLDPPALEAPELPWSEAEVEVRDGRAVCRVADDSRGGLS